MEGIRKDRKLKFSTDQQN